MQGETAREQLERWEFKAQQTHEECSQPSLLQDRFTILLCDCGKNHEPRRLCQFCWGYPLHPLEVQPTFWGAAQHALRHVA